MVSSIPTRDAIIELEAVAKHFGGAQAVDDITLSVAAGTVHALVGENGAGKSTLGKIIAGVYRRDEGTMRVAGRHVDYHSPRDALDDGVAIIFQELALVPQCTVMENVYLGRESSRRLILDDRRLRRRYSELSARTGFRLPADARVGDLRVADRQKVEIMRALAREARVIVMDEPTAALSRPEAELLLRDVRELREAGTTIIYVSHFLDEVFAISNAVTVLRDGHLVGTVRPGDATTSDVVTMMLGRRQIVAPPKRLAPADRGPEVLRAEGLSRFGEFRDVTLDLHAGEIVALAGLVGSGRSEIARALFGAARPDAGAIVAHGERVRLRNPRDGISRGIAMLPESRKEQGLIIDAPLEENLTLAALKPLSRFGVIRRRAERAAARRASERVQIRGGHLGGAVSQLSGGNQQKALFGKWLLVAPRVLIADEPTRGVDIGAKQTIYELLRELASQGMAVLVISSEIDEVVALADRVLVIRTGQIVAELSGDDIAEEAIMRAAFGAAESAISSNDEGVPE